MSEQTHRITLTLNDREFYALARMSMKECRALRGQAVYMLRHALATVGELPGAPTIFNPVPDAPAEVSGRD